MAEETGGKGEEAVEASGDSIVIAEAIFAGLAEIAGAIRELAAAMTGEDYGEPAEAEVYLDGSRKR